MTTFLTAHWTYNGFSTKEIGNYIRTSLESKVGEDKIGWQHKISGISTPNRGLNFISGGDIYLGTSLLAILVALSFAKFDLTEILLIIVDAVSVISSVVLLIQF